MQQAVSLRSARTRTDGKQDSTADWRTMEKADVMRDWLPTRALAMAITKQGQNMGCGMAL